MQVNSNTKKNGFSSIETGLEDNVQVIEELKIFRMIDDSMNDGTHESILNGDILNVIQVKKGIVDEYPPYAQPIYILHTRWGTVAVKVLEMGKEDVSCASLNKDKDKYPDFVLDYTDIFEMYRVISSQRTL